MTWHAGQTAIPTKKKPRPREGVLVSACIQYLYRINCFVWRNNTGSYKPEGSKRYIRYGFKGSPDIIGMTPSGRFIGIECKTPGREQSEEQVTFQKRVEQLGGIYILAYSLDDVLSRRGELS